MAYSNAKGPGEVRYTRRAFNDRRAIHTYLVERNPDAALRVDRLIAERIQQLGTMPERGRPTDRGSIRTIWIAPYPYRVFYRIGNETVEILHIRHTSRRIWTGGAIAGSER